MSQRDEQFMGFARAVVEEITGRDEYDECDMEEVIARRAYDLVAHTLWNTASLDLERLSIAENVERIPDLPVLPEEDAE